MSCEECRALLSEAVDGELGEAERLLVQQHLAHCEECRAYEAALRELGELLREDLPEPGEDFCGAVMEAVRAQSAPTRPVCRFPLRPLSLAASLLLLAGLGLYAGRSSFAGRTTNDAAPQSAEEPMLMMASADVAEAEAEAVPAEEAAPMEAAPAIDSACDPAGDNGMDPTLPLARLAAESWLWENGKEGFSVGEMVHLEELPPYESCLAGYSPVGGSTQVTCRSPEGGELALLVDGSGTVYGIVRES